MHQGLGLERSNKQSTKCEWISNSIGASIGAGKRLKPGKLQWLLVKRKTVWSIRNLSRKQFETVSILKKSNGDETNHVFFFSIKRIERFLDKTRHKDILFEQEHEKLKLFIEKEFNYQRYKVLEIYIKFFLFNPKQNEIWSLISANRCGDSSIGVTMPVKSLGQANAYLDTLR